MSDLVIRALTFEDLDDALRLSTTVGWNQLVEDWRMLLRLAPAGAFAALIDARVIGTAIGIDYGGFAWVAMMLVDPAHRGRGVGRRLLEATLDAVPPNLPVRLDATPLGRPLYQRYGFEDETSLSRHVAVSPGFRPEPVDGADLPANRLRRRLRRVSPKRALRAKAEAGSHEAKAGSHEFHVRPLTRSDLEIVIERDRDIFGGRRGAVLEWALQAAPQYAHIVRGGDGLIHYCLGRRGRQFDQIGPVVAGDEEIAQALVSVALAAAGDRPVVVDAFDSRVGFSAALRQYGFAVQRPLFRMCRRGNSEPHARSVRDAAVSAVREFAIFGPEFA